MLTLLLSDQQLLTLKQRRDGGVCELFSINHSRTRLFIIHYPLPLILITPRWSVRMNMVQYGYILYCGSRVVGLSLSFTLAFLLLLYIYIFFYRTLAPRKQRILAW